MGEWAFAVSPVDSRTRTTEELAALLPALSEVLGVRLVRMGGDGESISGHGVDERGTEFWLAGMFCDPGDFGRCESYQFEFSVDAIPSDDPGAIAAWFYGRLCDSGQFHAVLMRNSTAIEATEVDKSLWWT
ncbi:hypothetical protein AB0H83_29390 [Dactylosporangium sp. NPDC050688]|uniref:hypothetical protein n=1 Tax=Dactylosporangium sp. NPDC050688 TaxID=3157217 RepID=UPI0033EFFF46